ncbi:MAG: Lrp/AsnC ligand binding domain-containing protein [Candidatus Kariarchaeaceae archaeon]|jgi:DNA-binding Lrp family transcriptional regulator
MSAYVFVHLSQEFSGEDILTDVLKIPEVKFAYRLYGTYDLCLLIEGEDAGTIKELTLESVRTLRFVESTVTFIALEEFDKSN